MLFEMLFQKNVILLKLLKYVYVYTANVFASNISVLYFLIGNIDLQVQWQAKQEY